MADKGRQYNLSVLMGFVDNASAGVQKFTKSVQDNKQMLTETGIALGTFGGAITAALGLAVKAAADQELALNKLQTAVHLSGMEWRDAKLAIDEYTSSMQAMTMFGDTDMFPVIQQMLLYTDDLATAFDGATLAMDMAASGMFNLETAARYVGLTLDGNVQMLGRYIGELRESNLQTLGLTEKTERVDYALGLLQEKFGGMAEDQLSTFNGQVSQLKNYFQDLTEEIGNVFLPLLTDLARDMTAVVVDMKNWADENEVLFGTLVQLTADIGGTTAAIGALLLVLPNAVAAITQLWTLVAAHPWTAVAAAILAATSALTSYLEKTAEVANEEAERALALQQTHEGMAQMHMDRIREIAEELAATEAGTDEHIRLMTLLKATRKAYNDEMLAAEKEHNDKMVEEAEETAVQYSLLLQKQLRDYMVFSQSKKEQDRSWYITAIQNAWDWVEENYQSIILVTQLAADAYAAYYELRRTQIENYKEDQLKAIDDVYYAERNRILTQVEDEADRNRQLKLLDTQRNQDISEAQQKATDAIRKEKERQKVFLIGEVIANTASSIIKTYESYGGWTPWAIVAAALMAAEGAFQLAQIQAIRYQTGGENIPGGPVLVGEEGPELFFAPRGSTIRSATDTASLLGGKQIIEIKENYFVGTGGMEQLVDMISDIQLQRVRDVRNF